MRLFEYQGKQLFSQFNVPVLPEYYAESEDEISDACAKTGFPVVIKAQVLTGGRGKAGGVKIANSLPEALTYAEQIIGMKIKDETCHSVLLVHKAPIKREFYMGITNDSSVGKAVLMFSTYGGMDIENVPHDKIVKFYIPPCSGVEREELRSALAGSGIEAQYLEAVTDIADKLITAFLDADCTTAEINPLAVLEDDSVIALDSKVVIDDSALPRHKDLLKYNTEAVSEAPKGYVELNGDIAVVTGGAGLGMATMDLVTYYGGKVACFLDYGAGAYDLTDSADMGKALSFVLGKPTTKGVIVNVFGGLVSCVPLAKGVIDYVNENHPTQKIVLKIRGHYQEEAWRMLDESTVRYISTGTTEEAIRALLELMNEVN